MMMTMIKANELRIGNVITHDNNVIEVLGITKHCGDFAIDNIGKWVYLKNCKLIILTEEILLKCGFENKGIDDNWIIFRFKSIRICKTEMLGFIFNFDNGEEYVKVKYLHQLQNLYLCLCGEELEINL